MKCPEKKIVTETTIRATSKQSKDTKQKIITLGECEGADCMAWEPPFEFGAFSIHERCKKYLCSGQNIGKINDRD